MHIKAGMLLWEAMLTFVTFVGGALSLAPWISPKVVFLAVVLPQAANSATIVYKTGQWNPNMTGQPPVQVNVAQAQPPPIPPVG